MTREQVRKIVKETGVKKGYRLECPDDFYKGLTKEDLYEYTKNKSTACYFRQVNDIIMECFPTHTFYEWKFEQTTKGWLDLNTNKIKFLTWLGKELNFLTEEDWYNLTQKMLNSNYGRNLLHKYQIYELPSILYPNYEFLPFKFVSTIDGWWHDINNKKKYLMWLGEKMGWTKPEDWYNLTNDILNENYGSFLIKKSTFIQIPNILYPDYKFDILKFKSTPRNMWSNFDNVKNVLLEFCEKNGRMPTQKEAMQIDNGRAWIGIRQNGGIVEIAKKLGFHVSRQYLTLSGEIVKSMFEVLFANFLFLNKIPFKYEGNIIKSKKYRFDFKINDVFVEIWGVYESVDRDVYGKTRALKEQVYKDNNMVLISIEKEIFKEANIKVNEHFISLMKEYGIKQDNFYNEDLTKLNYFESFNKDRIIEDLRSECENRELIQFPAKSWWDDNGFKKHMSFLQKNNISMHYLANEFKLQQSKNRFGQYDDIEILLNELEEIYKEIGVFPTRKYLEENNSNLISAINKHGGTAKIAKLMNCETKHKEKGYWTWENLEKEIRPMCEQLNRMIKPCDLTNNSYLQKAINSHGGYSDVAIKLGYNPSRTKNGSWKDWDYFSSKFIPICDEFGGFPTTTYLKKIGRSDIIHAISRYYDIDDIKSRLNLK